MRKCTAAWLVRLTAERNGHCHVCPSGAKGDEFGKYKSIGLHLENKTTFCSPTTLPMTPFSAIPRTLKSIELCILYTFYLGEVLF
jgi:hypothetical protein